MKEAHTVFRWYNLAVHGVYSAMIYDWLKVYGLEGIKIINFDRYKYAFSLSVSKMLTHMLCLLI